MVGDPGIEVFMIIEGAVYALLTGMWVEFAIESD